eukprot:TRINITY_DN8369_c0_g1_i1.p1 TRINITY_DN8369_c0_g1~~TRINITY_DN8369_c0_g1_i1.p1  ORF type:complete len:627 (+),score=160.53 TRINITY_DN8369_c0_g1_i1:31-1911(+)
MKGRVVCLLLATVFVLSISEWTESKEIRMRRNIDRSIIFNRRAAPPSWELLRRAASNEEHSFFIALPQRNLDLLEKKYWAVSDPDSEDYGNFLSQEEILQIVKPDAKAVQEVLLWLSKYGVSNIKNFGDAIRVTAAVEAVEKLFQTELHLFRHKVTGRKLRRNLGTYSIPKYLTEHISFVTGISDFIPDRPKSKRTSIKSRVSATRGVVIPATLQTMYQIPSTLTVTTNASQGPVEFQDDASISLQDCDTFDDLTNIPHQPAPTIVGPFSGEDGESILDYEYITAVGQQAHNFFWTEVDWLYEFTVNFFNTTDVPLVISLSWGWSEGDQCEIESDCRFVGGDSTLYVERVNAEFQKIGLRGVTILVASGDSGANGRTDEYCLSRQLYPDFPAASPYVLSVGATQLEPNATTSSTVAPVCKEYTCAVNGTETAVSYGVASFTSGGGFSNVAPQPAYQKSAVSAYLQSGVKLPPTTYFNVSGRAYPDIAALGTDILIVMSGYPTLTGGTSASSPIIAGIITLLNDYRLKRGLSPLGPFNPLLYKIGQSHPAAFHDVTVGDNTCTEGGCVFWCKGFYCAKGWDPVTGWGSPNFQEMLSFITSFDDRRLAQAKKTKKKNGKAKQVLSVVN